MHEHAVTAERPILFSGPMVRAILAGKKSQTRRVVKPSRRLVNHVDETRRIMPDARGMNELAAVLERKRCHYGVPGDSLWVRETCDYYGGDEFIPVSERRTIYRADGEAATPHATGRWCSPLLMPRWASRLTLRVTDVRVERLQRISEEDAIAEGVDAIPDAPAQLTRRGAFAGLWDRINGKRAPWSSNPWVWVVSFEVVNTRAGAAL